MSEQGADDTPTATTEPTGSPLKDGLGSLGRQMVVSVGESDTVDLTRYKTDELRERFSQLFGVTHFLPWAGAGLAAPVVIAVVIWSVWFLPRATPVVAGLVLVYMLLQSIFCGNVLAALLVVSRIFQQLAAIIDITIQTIREALRDLRSLGDPKVRAELSGALIHGAILPTVQSAVTVRLGFLRAPISWVLNKILGKTADKLTDSIKRRLLSDDGGDAETPETDDADSQSTSDRAETHLDRMQDRIELIARRTRRATLVPTTLLFLVVSAISSIPWLVVGLFLF